MTSLLNRVAITCLAFVLLAACAGLVECAAPKPPAKEYQMRGEVMGLDAPDHVATIKHEAIPGFMGAMTMGYPVKDPAEFSKLSAGEQITATIYQSGDDFWIGNIKPSSAPGGSPAAEPKP